MKRPEQEGIRTEKEMIGQETKRKWQEWIRKDWELEV